MQRNKTGKKVDCPKCKYTWLTKSKMYFVPCPRCHKLIQIRTTQGVDLCENENTPNVQNVVK